MAQKVDFEKVFGNRNALELSTKPLSKEDEELMAFLEESAPKIAVIGAGGSGSNTINRLSEMGITGAKIIATNTDAQHLMITKAEKKILMGKVKTKGRGAG